MTRHRAVITRDDDGVWLVDFPDLPGCQTYGRTLAQARASARDALALWLDLPPEDVEVEEDLQLPDELAAAVDAAVRRQSEAAAAQDAATEVLGSAVQRLAAAGISASDAAALVGVSPQRVQALLRRSA